MFSIGVILLAAGRSTRMGRPKLLLSWGQTSVLGHLLQQWAGLGARQIAVVCPGDDSVIAGELDRLGFRRENRIPNPDPDRGMFSSILCAAQWDKWQSSLSHWTVVLGDQPHLRHKTVADLLDFARGHPDHVCQPVRAGKPRHPVVLPKAIFFQLAKSSSRDLREFLANYPVLGCECDDPGLELDIDRPDDYRRALALAQRGLLGTNFADY